MGKGKVWFGPSNVWVYSIRQNAICIDFRQNKLSFTSSLLGYIEST